MRIINGVKVGVKSVIRPIVKADEFGHEYNSRFIVPCTGVEMSSRIRSEPARIYRLSWRRRHRRQIS